jgi:chemotaxis protein MotB
LRPEGTQALQILAAELSQILQTWCSSDQEFRIEALFIEGHTDNVPIKNARFADNWELSTSRAVNVARAFKQSQPQLAQFENPRGLPVLGVSGYGENRPVAENTTEEGRRRNRRIDLRFLVAYPTDEQISKVTHGLISPDATRPSSQRDTNTNQ